MAKKIEEQLLTSEGVVAFVELWTLNIKNHGISFIHGSAADLMDFANNSAGVLSRFKELQDAMSAMTGEESERKYVMLGVQTLFMNFPSEKKKLASAVKVLSLIPSVNILVLHTHIYRWSPCVVAAHTILRNTLPYPLPAVDTTLELLELGNIPENVTVVLTFSSGFAVFEFSTRIAQDDSVYGKQCEAGRQVLASYQNICRRDILRSLIFMKDEPAAVIRMMAYRDGGDYTVGLFETKESIHHKMSYVYKNIRRRRLGWALQYMDKEDTRNHCNSTEFPHGYVILNSMKQFLVKRKNRLSP